MKSKFFLALLLLSSIMSFAQTAKKPTIMVIPSDHWCTSWTNTLDDATDYWAKCAIFSPNENLFKPSHTSRTNGLSVRAVVKK
jgi:hypothetical protein